MEVPSPRNLLRGQWKKSLSFECWRNRCAEWVFIQTRPCWNELCSFSGQLPEGNTNSPWEYSTVMGRVEKGKKKMPVRFSDFTHYEPPLRNNSAPVHAVQTHTQSYSTQPCMNCSQPRRWSREWDVPVMVGVSEGSPWAHTCVCTSCQRSWAPAPHLPQTKQH